MAGYQALYNRERPHLFRELAGQEAIARALSNAVTNDRLAHAYLFSGTRGTGKTTSARILAQVASCTKRETGSADPCGECPSCVAITTMLSPDLIEVDAASNRGIDEIRSVRDHARKVPDLGCRKVYIIDEAHMLTNEAANALLKILEEPPAHILFILCTTDPQKLPTTILSRCQHFSFRRIPEATVENRLREIAAREGVQVEPGVIEMVSRAADGSMRDAVVKLDQMFSAADGKLGIEVAREILAVPDGAYARQLVDEVLSGRSRDALTLLRHIREEGVDNRQLVKSLLRFAGDAAQFAAASQDTELLVHANQLSTQLLEVDREARMHGDPEFYLEAVLVRQAAAAYEKILSQPIPEQLSEGAPKEVVRTDGKTPPAAKPGPAAGVQEPAPTPKAQQDAAPKPEAAAAAAGDDAARWKAGLARIRPVEAGYFRGGKPSFEEGRVVITFSWKFHYVNARQALKMAEEAFGQPVELVYSGKEPLEGSGIGVA